MGGRKFAGELRGSIAADHAGTDDDHVLHGGLAVRSCERDEGGMRWKQ